MRELTDFEKRAREAQIDLLKLEIAENRKHNLIMTGIIVGLFSFLVIFLASLFVWAYSHQQDNFLGFLGGYKIDNEVVGNPVENAVINHAKNYAESGNMNANTSNININSTKSIK